MLPDVVIGGDPGKKGAFSFLSTDSAVPVTATLMPLFKSSVDDTDIDARGIADIIAKNLRGRRAVACVEEVFARARQAGQTPFIRGYGKILGVLELLDIPYILVTPQAWKKSVLGTRFNHKDKEGTMQWVRQTFPEFNLIPPGKRVPSDGYADSVALAYYRMSQLVRVTSPLIKPL